MRIVNIVVGALLVLISPLVGRAFAGSSFRRKFGATAVGVALVVAAVGVAFLVMGIA